MEGAGVSEEGTGEAEAGVNDNKEDKSDTTSKDWDRLKKMTDKEITKKDLQMAASVALSSAAVKAKVRTLWLMLASRIFFVEYF